VANFAERLAARLGLPHHPIVTRLDDRPEQRRQQNSAHQQANVAGAFAVVGAVIDAPVLLVDDVVDSTWTITEIGRLLGRAGAPLVYPVALASSAGRD
jgi:ATP-dependent DNA helicase RecQ